MSDPRYPIGPFQAGGKLDPEERAALLQQIEEAPAKLREAVAGLDDAQLDTPYREGGWTVRQVVHHVVDSHINAYIRLRWALTEDGPTVEAYEEKDWAQLPDASSAPIAMSLNLLDALHVRWLVPWQAMKEGDFQRDLEGTRPRLPTRGRPGEVLRLARRRRGRLGSVGRALGHQLS